MNPAMFNRFMVDAVISRSEATHLLKLANTAFDAQEIECNTNKSAKGAVLSFERYAKKLGLEVLWPGMWPVLKKNGKEIHLPE